MSQNRYGLKNSLLLILVFLLSIGCEDVIQLDLPTSEPQLVIDALLGYNNTNGEPITMGQVKLTLTAPFFEEVPPAQNAQVAIIDEATGITYGLTEDAPGVFMTGIPNLVFNRNYTLEVEYLGEVYKATEQLVKSSVIDNLEQDDGFLFDEESETEVKVTFTDLPGERNNYLFSFGFNNFLVIDDEFFQDSQLTFSYFYEDINPGRTIAVTLLGADREFANYAEQILAQSGEDGNGGNGPFAVPTATVRGNIMNTTNPDNFPFGYFALSELDTKFLTIE